MTKSAEELADKYSFDKYDAPEHRGMEEALDAFQHEIAEAKEDALAGYNAGYKAGQEARWISVEDELPKDEGYYWIWNGEEVFLADFNPDCVSDDGVFSSSGFSIGEDPLDLDEVLKWTECHKPAAPTEKGEG